MPSTRTNEELTPLIEAQIKSVLSDPTAAEQDYTPQFDLSVPSKHFAASIDHTILKPNASFTDIKKICAEAREYGFKSVCVNPINIPLVAKLLDGSSSIPCSVICFPLGAVPTASKVHEASFAISQGAKEIDMVISVSNLKSSPPDYAYLLHDISSVVETCGDVPVKVIIETVFLSDEEKIAACWLSAEAGAAFVKTSTGFNGGGATVKDVRLMRRSVSYKGEGVVKVKASGGVRTFEQCAEMLRNGASRIGASAGVEIMKGEVKGGAGY